MAVVSRASSVRWGERQARDLDYGSHDDIAALNADVDRIAAMITALEKSLQKRLTAS